MLVSRAPSSCRLPLALFVKLPRKTFECCCLGQSAIQSHAVVQTHNERDVVVVGLNDTASRVSVGEVVERCHTNHKQTENGRDVVVEVARQVGPVPLLLARLSSCLSASQNVLHFHKLKGGQVYNTYFTEAHGADHGLGF